MNFTPVNVDDVLIGHECVVNDVRLFFGTAVGTRELLAAAYPRVSFCEMKQVHGRTVAEAAVDQRPEADALATSVLNCAPIVVTADCLPVLLASRTRWCAVHAGWRGVEADVIGAALNTFAKDDPPLLAAIGPHLNQSSFEVGRDVADRLTRSAPPGLRDLTRPHADDAKVYFDLTAVARAQVRRAGSDLTLLEFTADTLTNATYHSYRRRPLPVGRNLSFVVRNA